MLQKWAVEVLLLLATLASLWVQARLAYAVAAALYLLLHYVYFFCGAALFRV